MARVRKIQRNPKTGRNYFVLDACFLVNKYIPVRRAPTTRDKDQIKKCLEWWDEIETQLKKHKARVYVPDICIAETFKTLAKKYFVQGWFNSAAELNNARIRLRKDIVTTTRTMRAYRRHIRYHDISTSRDIIISVDRFLEIFLKKRDSRSVSVPDLIIVATAKHLIDFYDIPKERVHIVTLDTALWKGSKRIQELPNAYNPIQPPDARDRIFE